MAEVNNDSIYYPRLRCDDEKNPESYHLELYSSLQEIYDQLNKSNDEGNVKQLKLFIYNYVKLWWDNFKQFSFWEKFIQKSDPQNRKIVLSRYSSINDWQFLQYRLGVYYDVNKLHVNFLNSNYDFLSDYISQEIFNVCQILIQLESITMDKDVKSAMLSKFKETYFDSLNKYGEYIPSLIDEYLFRNIN